MGELIGRVQTVRVGRVHEHDWGGRQVRSGAVKDPVAGAVPLGQNGFTGDEQADLAVHGGPEKAVLVYNGAHYPRWLADGLELPEGALFENLTLTGPDPETAGPDETTVVLGETWRLGTAVVQVSQPRSPCWKLARRWGVKDLVVRVQQTGRTGWYLRVLEPGQVAADDLVELLDRPAGAPTVADVGRVVNVDTDDLAGAARLVDAPGVPERWRTKLRARLAGEPTDDAARLRGPST